MFLFLGQSSREVSLAMGSKALLRVVTSLCGMLSARQARPWMWIQKMIPSSALTRGLLNVLHQVPSVHVLNPNPRP